MEEVKVTDLRRNLTNYLARVQRGRHLSVTSRGKVIAEIVPPSPSRKEIEAARARLRGSVLHYDRPFGPAIEAGDWTVNS